ncbi:hypothetical protein HMPREF9278_1099 [Mobiluncus mulieris FB024-16]|nr:hypothetical protein HMPREF9278_1099 [Mobiluncus mulieris FB024-16]
MVYGYEDNHRQFSLVDPGVFGVFGCFGGFWWGLVTNPGFFGTGWLIWLQVWLLFPEIVTNPSLSPGIFLGSSPKLHTEQFCLEFVVGSVCRVGFSRFASIRDGTS